MFSEDEPSRRGRREAVLGPAVPEHRRVLAQRLRDLRTECHAPPYRVLSGLSHCAAGTLSEAASGRRLPTWETTQAYVTGCLRHAGRDGDLARVLPRWRVEWERANLTEEARRDETRPVVAASAALAQETPRDETPRRGASRARFAVAAVILLLTATALRASGTAGPALMTGLYNIVLTPSSWDGPGERPHLAGRLQWSIGQELRAWASGMPSIQLRLPEDLPGSDSGAGATLDRIADRHGADVVLRPALRLNAGRLTTTVEIFLADRILGETPEFSGRHDISLTEPPDIVEENLALAEGLTSSTRHYLSAVVLFVRGIGAYAGADFALAESRFRDADREFDTVADTVGDQQMRRAVVHLMIGNAVGAQDPARAVEHFRRALTEDAGYRRAEVGLAEALRAAQPCTPKGTDVGRLREAAGHYRRSLALAATGQQAPSPLLDMKAGLGLGLTDQCLSLAGAEGAWHRADAEFAQVIRLQSGAGRTVAGARQARWLAAEARAGQALDALAGARAYAAAATGYEQALDTLGGIDALRGTQLRRQLVFLRNLRFAYQQLGDSAAVVRTDQRIDRTDRRLSALPTGR